MKMVGLIYIGIALLLSTAHAETYWMKVEAKDKYERSAIANAGADIETVMDDYVIAFGNKKSLQKIKQTNKLLTSFVFDPSTMDFPSQDSNFHNYGELKKELEALAANNPDIVALSSLGKSLEGRELFVLKISKQSSQNTKPAIFFLGTHHAREHISTEMPLLLAQHLVKEYRTGNTQIQSMIDNKEIWIAPLINPDGIEYDISSGNYKMWRKNRRDNKDGNYGVDLNRNYGFQWGTGGSSNDSDSDVFMGPTPFSEPETIAVKNFVDSHSNITILLSFHTFSKLILYPWGHKYDKISDARDLAVHKTMAETMAKWNGYVPQQSSDLYIASGDTTDWSYGAHRIISFTFELDPGSMWDGGFYPGQAMIPTVFQKNLQPCLYLIDLADNPYRVLDHSAWGVSDSIIQTK